VDCEKIETELLQVQAAKQSAFSSEKRFFLKGDCAFAADFIFLRLAPLQQKILLAIFFGEMLTLEELARQTGSSRQSVAKQLSIFQFRSKYNNLKKMGISTPIVKKRKDENIKTAYFLHPNVIKNNKISLSSIAENSEMIPQPKSCPVPIYV